MTARALLIMGVVLAQLASAGCSDDLPSFFDIEKFRLLGIRSDPPTIDEGETATFSALVTDADAEFQWTWCPLSSGSFNNFECAITEQELQATVDQVLGEGVVTVPPFDLGTNPTATFTFDIPAALFSGVCDLISMNELPEGASFPDCDEGYDLEIRVDTRLGDEEVRGVRDLRLLLEDEHQRNNNPTILGIRAVDPDTGADIALEAGTPAQLERGRVYPMFVDIDQADAETFLEVPVGETDPVEVRDELTVTWFREGGDFDKGRTGFIDEVTEFEVLLENEFTVPSAEDYEDSELRLFWVIRDNRGGVGFASRTIELVQP